MKTITTHNIFEASYYLTDESCVLSLVDTSENIPVYSLLIDDEKYNEMRELFVTGMANANVSILSWKFGDLYRKSGYAGRIV